MMGMNKKGGCVDMINLSLRNLAYR